MEPRNPGKGQSRLAHPIARPFGGPDTDPALGDAIALDLPDEIDTIRADETRGRGRRVCKVETRIGEPA